MLQLGEARGRRVLVVGGIAGGRDRGLDDVVRGREVGLTGPEPELDVTWWALVVIVFVIGIDASRALVSLRAARRYRAPRARLGAAATVLLVPMLGLLVYEEAARDPERPVPLLRR